MREPKHVCKWCLMRTSLRHVVIALVLLIAVHKSCAKDRNEQMQQLRQCFDAAYSSRPRHWKHFYEDNIVHGMTLEKMWWSNNEPTANVTVVTQLSMSRLGNFEQMCRSWGGPVSAAVYVPLIQDQEELTPSNVEVLQRSTSKIEELFHRTETDHACQLDIMLVYEVLQDNTTAALYPVNYLRNYALLQATTDLVIFNDVDLLFSSGLLGHLQNPVQFSQLHSACNSSIGFIFPAFETTRKLKKLDPDLPMQVARNALTGTKGQLSVLRDADKVQQFHAIVRRGHGPTDYPRWFRTRFPYEVDFSFGFEPWYMAYRTKVPFYDVRLRGYGMNKAVQSYHAYKTGMKFYVWPHNWLVHLPHKSTASQKLFTSKNNTNELSLYDTNGRITKKIVKDIRTQEYTPTVDSVTMKCIQALDWWDSSPWSATYRTLAQTPSPPPSPPEPPSPPPHSRPPPPPTTTTTTTKTTTPSVDQKGTGVSLPTPRGPVADVVTSADGQVAALGLNAGALSTQPGLSQTHEVWQRSAKPIRLNT